MEDNPWCICTSKMVSKGVNHPPQNWPLCLWLSPPPPHDYFKPPLSHCNYDKALWPCLLLPQVPSSKSPRQAIHLPPGLTNSPRLPQHTNKKHHLKQIVPSGVCYDDTKPDQVPWEKQGRCKMCKENPTPQRKMSSKFTWNMLWVLANVWLRNVRLKNVWTRFCLR